MVSPAEAIEAAALERLGPGVIVEIASISTSAPPQAGLLAVPEPGARLGSPARFTLLTPCPPSLAPSAPSTRAPSHPRTVAPSHPCRVRAGTAVATVRARGPHMRAARTLERGDAITGDAVVTVDDLLPDVALERMPTPGDVAGSIARRRIVAGEPLTTATVVVPPLVRAGQTLALTVVVGGVRATGAGVAAASGRAGDVIPVMPTPDRRSLRARITGQGTAEVIQ
jgi:flagella basal body P-ring formation protein FlgA